MIRNVIFDIGRVMIEFNWEEFLCKLFDPETAKTVSDAMWGTPAWNELDRNVLPMEEVEALFIANAPDCAEQIREAIRRMGECPEMMPYAVSWSEELRAKNLRVFFLSNYSEYLMLERPDVLEFTKHMDGGIYSWQVRLTKPDPEIYRCLLERYDLKAEECIFIDDSPKNIAAANALGLHAFLFESYEKQHAQVAEYLAEHTK